MNSICQKLLDTSGLLFFIYRIILATLEGGPGNYVLLACWAASPAVSSTLRPRHGLSSPGWPGSAFVSVFLSAMGAGGKSWNHMQSRV